jgi:RimJ/RimL family protein N-acetyltransferase
MAPDESARCGPRTLRSPAHGPTCAGDHGVRGSPVGGGVGVGPHPVARNPRARGGTLDGVEILLETARMVLRQCDEHDVDRLVELHNDPAVMRFLGPCQETVEHVRDEVLPHWQRLYADGFGYWAAIERATGAFLGWFLLRPPKVDPQPGVLELGYRLHVAAWGRGFATEGSTALVDRGFAGLGAQRIVADTMAVNLGSRRVLEKVGLRYLRTVYPHYDEPLDGAEHGDVEYALTREEWSAARAPGPGPSAARPR